MAKSSVKMGTSVKAWQGRRDIGKIGDADVRRIDSLLSPLASCSLPTSEPLEYILF